MTSGQDLPAEEMREAQQRLCLEGFRATKTSEFQLKIGTVNFYPSTGTITVDGYHNGAVGRGIEALIALLKKQKTMVRR